jgi:uncharacterized protein YndB with AHSA1/START domain
MSAPVAATPESRELFARELHIFIQAPCEVVFQYVADISRHSEWASNPLVIRHVAGPASGPGATFESEARPTARGLGTVTGRIRILEAEPPHRLVYEAQDNTGRYRWTMMLQADADGTRVTQRMAKHSGPWFINLIQPVVIWPLLGRPSVQRGLETIKDRLERPR